MASRSLADDPLSTVLIVANFAVFVWTIYKMERQLNREGESLFRLRKVRNPVKYARRIDGVLATSIRRLASCGDEELVLATLRLQVGELPREARERALDKAEGTVEDAIKAWQACELPEADEHTDCGHGCGGHGGHDH